MSINLLAIFMQVLLASETERPIYIEAHSISVDQTIILYILEPSRWRNGDHRAVFAHPASKSQNTTPSLASLG